jgi:ribosome biogenesis GTPase
MRELGMWDVAEGLSEGFSDVEDFFDKCKFSNCKHQSEPGCAIKAAIENGELPLGRWESYLALKRESAFVENRAAYLRKKTARDVAIKVRERQKKKGGKTDEHDI